VTTKRVFNVVKDALGEERLEEVERPSGCLTYAVVRTAKPT
jgi:hypothetical protein